MPPTVVQIPSSGTEAHIPKSEGKFWWPTPDVSSPAPSGWARSELHPVTD